MSGLANFVVETASGAEFSSAQSRRRPKSLRCASQCDTAANSQDAQLSEGDATAATEQKEQVASDGITSVNWRR